MITTFATGGPLEVLSVGETEGPPVKFGSPGRFWAVHESGTSGWAFIKRWTGNVNGSWQSFGVTLLKNVIYVHDVAPGFYRIEAPSDVVVWIYPESRHVNVSFQATAPLQVNAVLDSNDSTVGTLSWIEPVHFGDTPLLKYQYRVNIDGASWSAWTDVAGGVGARLLNLTNLVADTVYTYQVRAITLFGSSASSAIPSLTTPA